MGRLMPFECEHGRVIDWGDFGGDNSEPQPCAECDAMRATLRAKAARLIRRVANFVDGG